MKSTKLQISNIKMENGLSLIGESYKAASGFVYASGHREFGNLSIIEEVGSGTAVTLLLEIKVFDKEGALIIDKKLNKNNYCERELTRKIVRLELVKMLSEANGNSFDLVSAKKKIDELLHEAYYKTSYKAILKWASEIGIY